MQRRVQIQILLLVVIPGLDQAWSQNCTFQAASHRNASSEVHTRVGTTERLCQYYASHEPQCQSDTLPGSSRWYDVIGRDVGAFCRAGLHLAGAPARWDGRDLMHASAIIGITGLAAFADDDMRDMVFRSRSATADNVESVVRLAGEVWLLAALAGGAYGAGLLIEDDWLRETAFLAGTSLILTTVAARIMKTVVGRGRPYYTDDPATFRMFSLADAYNAFPSGHSVAAFSVSAVLAYRIDNVWATAGLYGLAALTAFSRVYADEHWFSDTVFGALFSTALTRSVIAWYTGERGDTPDSGFRVLPTTNGIMFTYEF